MKGFIKTIQAMFLTLAIIGGLWFVSGYLLQNYVGLEWAIAYGVLPVIYFGFKGLAKEALVTLLVVALAGGIWGATIYLFNTVLLFRQVLAYCFLPVVFIMFILLSVIIFPVEYSKYEENKDATKEN